MHTLGEEHKALSISEKWKKIKKDWMNRRKRRVYWRVLHSKKVCPQQCLHRKLTQRLSSKTDLKETQNSMRNYTKRMPERGIFSSPHGFTT